MKAYATEVVEPNNPKLGQGEDPAEYFPPPMNVMQMLRYKDGKKKTAWLKALKKELKTIIDSGTLNNRENPKPDDVVVSTTEANKIKLDQQGNVDKLKVRVCVRGDLQKKKDPTMEDPHSPAASMRMSKLVMAEAARHKARVFQLDVIGAFLQARMRSRVFITLPRVYGEIFPEFKAYCGRPVLLVKAMYGMTLSGKYWYEEFKEWLVSIGFNICPTCPVLFTRIEADGTLLRLIVYIDDCLYFSTSDVSREKFQKQLVDRFNVELQGQAHWYLAARISQDKDFNVTMDQSRYAKSIVTRYLDAAGVKKSNMPHGSILPMSLTLTSKDLAETPEESSKLQEAYNIDYASCIGSLIYLSYTRPDITFAVNKLAKYSRQPGEQHMLALIHLLRYVKQHTQLGLTFYSDITQSPVYKLLQENNITPSRNMFTFSDSSWDDDHDTSRSTGGFLIFYQGGIVDHSSNMPDPVAMSSAEAEYNEACMACMATSHMHMTLNHIEDVKDGSPEDKPIHIYMDNRSAVDMSITFKDTKNSRHIRRRFHFVKQGVEDEWHLLVWLSNVAMVADGMTKVLPKKDLLHKVQYMLTSIDRD